MRTIFENIFGNINDACRNILRKSHLSRIRELLATILTKLSRKILQILREKTPKEFLKTDTWRGVTQIIFPTQKKSITQPMKEVPH